MKFSPLSLFITSLGLALVMEGSLYALLPHTMKRILEQMKEFSPSSLRNMGLGVMIVGLILVYLGMGHS